jgi:NADH-quinone oxidoreductase subunit E
MYNKKPIGKYHIEVCHNIACMVRGGDELIEHISKKLGVREGETTADGLFTLDACECLGACANAPCLMIGEKYYENVSQEQADSLLEELSSKTAVKS